MQRLHVTSCPVVRPATRSVVVSAGRAPPCHRSAYVRAEAELTQCSEILQRQGVRLYEAAIKCAAPVALAALLAAPGIAQAADQVGNFGASGFIFKDSVEVVAIDDPDGEVPAALVCRAV